MNESTKKSRDVRRFSPNWCIGTTVFHFAATFALAGIGFVVGMGAFTTNTYEAQHIGSAIAFWRGVQWLWTPLAMATLDSHKIIDTKLLVGLAFVWSCTVGIIVGFFIPALRGWLHKPLYPPPTLNDNNRDA